MPLKLINQNPRKHTQAQLTLVEPHTKTIEELMFHKNLRGANSYVFLDNRSY